jgi:hypothetical protein
VRYRLFEPHPSPSDDEILPEKAYRRLQHNYQEVEYRTVQVCLPLEDAIVKRYYKVSAARAERALALM